jgi:ABC-type glycerol-3-phosphate transport system substrate-binding protein
MKKLVLFLLVISIFAGITGCSGQERQDIDFNKKGELIVYHPFGSYNIKGPNSPEYLLRAKEVFESKFKNMTVKLKGLALNSMEANFDYIQPFIDSNKSIDVFLSNDLALTGFSNDENTVMLDDYINANNKYLEKVYSKDRLEEAKVKGTTFALPVMSLMAGMIYNKNIVGKYDIKLDPAWTWEDFYSICKTISTNDKILPEFFTYPGSNSFDTYFMDQYIGSYGIRLFNEQYDKTNLLQPYFMDWLGFEKRLLELNSICSPVVYNERDGFRGMDSLNSGDFAFQRSYVSMPGWSNLKENWPNVDIINYPNGSEDGFYQRYNTYAYIHKTSTLPKEAFEFLKILISDEVQRAVVAGGYGDPVNKSVFKETLESLPEEQKKTYEHICSKAKNVKETRETSLARYSQVQQALGRKLALKEKIDENFLKQLSVEVENSLKKMN